MRAYVCLFALALVGCEHGFENTWHKPTAPPPTPTAREGVGTTHEPYAGKPKYLAEARPLLPTTTARETNPCATRSASCDVKLRAQLAAVDAQLLAVDSPPTETQLEALRLSLAQLVPLMAAYPDMAAEREELQSLVDKLPSLQVADQVAAKKRMIELTDLIRLQLSAAQ